MKGPSQVLGLTFVHKYNQLTPMAFCEYSPCDPVIIRNVKNSAKNS